MHTKRLRIMSYQSGLLAAAHRDISVTISDSTHQSHLLTLSFPHCMWAKAHLKKKKTESSVSLWMEHSREDYTFLFFSNRENSNHCPTFLPFPHSTLQISKCFHHLCLICLFPFQAISWMLFLNPLLLLCTQGWIPATCIVGAVTSYKVTSTSFTWSAQKKEVHAHTVSRHTNYYVWRQGKSGQKQNAGTTGKIPGQGKGLKSYSSVRFHLGTPKTCIRI